MKPVSAVRFRLLAVLAIGALLLGACSSGEPTETAAAEPTTVPTVAPTATPVPPTATAVPPTATAVPPTATPVPPTATPVPEPAGCTAPAPNIITSGSLESSGNTYEYVLNVPSGYEAGTPAPLLLNFHGLGSNGGQQAAFSMVPVSTSRYLAVHPTGQSGIGNDTRNSWELPQFDTDDRDDVQFASDLIDHIAEIACVDQSRVYATGMSNGGLLTSSLVCSLSNRIAAAASVAGVTHPDDCDPERAVPYIAFHGTDDAVVPFDGGGDSQLGAGEFFEQVMPEEFSQFADTLSCTSSEDIAVTAAVTRTDYAGCDNDAELSFYAVEGAGHTWPGSIVSLFVEDLGVTSMDVSATDLMLEFFDRHQLG